MAFLLIPAVVAFERVNAVDRCVRLSLRAFPAALARLVTVAALLAVSGIGAVLVVVLLNQTRPGSAAEPAGAVLVLAVDAVLGGAVAVLANPLLLTAYADVRARAEPFTTAMLVPAADQPDPLAADEDDDA
jgi:hypothetical protein